MHRHLLVTLGFASLFGCASPLTRPPASALSLGDLESRLGPGGRIGVAVVDFGSDREWLHAAERRFAFCSTFKLSLAAAVLEGVEEGRIKLDRRLHFGPTDVLSYAPVVKARQQQGWLTVAELAQAVVTVSDNSAANLLLPLVGGPSGMTMFMRKVGDRMSRLDRNEPELNENAQGDERDTTTPLAMARQVKTLFAGTTLNSASKSRLAGWMVDASTGRDRLRAGFPPGWAAGDKTGTCARGASNDVAIAWPQGRAPLAIASYLDGGDASQAERNAIHAEIGRRVAAIHR